MVGVDAGAQVAHEVLDLVDRDGVPDTDGVASTITVERSYDPVAGQYISPKSHAGTRRVPMTQELRGHLAAHRKRLGRGTGLSFGRSATRPFDDRALKIRAEKAWNTAGLTSITLHEARHTYASLLIAAGVSSKAVSTYMGHASITITLDRYGHLFPGNEARLRTGSTGTWQDSARVRTTSQQNVERVIGPNCSRQPNAKVVTTASRAVGNTPNHTDPGPAPGAFETLSE